MTEPEKPVIFSKLPKSVKLEPNIYFYCNCGRSADGLFCDGSHKGTSFSPKRFKVEERKDAILCQCKYSKNKPYCDGSHRQFPDDV